MSGAGVARSSIAHQGIAPDRHGDRRRNRPSASLSVWTWFVFQQLAGGGQAETRVAPVATATGAAKPYESAWRRARRLGFDLSKFFYRPPYLRADGLVLAIARARMHEPNWPGLAPASAGPASRRPQRRRRSEYRAAASLPGACRQGSHDPTQVRNSGLRRGLRDIRPGRLSTAFVMLHLRRSGSVMTGLLLGLTVAAQI